MSKTKRKAIVWAVILSESSHVFCCVLPTLFSVLSLMAGAGVISVMPGFMVEIHEVLHGYELPMIFVSAFILAVGWGLHWYSRSIDCHDTGCGHGPCDTKKDNTHLLLLGASVLFLINVTVYGVFHRGMDAAIHEETHGGAHAEDHGHAHDEVDLNIEASDYEDHGH